MAPARQRIVVVGTSAGGLEALDNLVGQFPRDLPATILIVQHMPPEAMGNALLNRLRRHRALGCKMAENGEEFERGRIYIAPPDYHLLIKKTKLLVTKGARENRFRPAIDPLFRSAAIEHGPRVIGALLTGLLNDGSAGLLAIQRCGGVTIVQDPSDAAYPDMPRNALNSLQVDHCVGLSELGGLIDRLTRQPLRKRKSIPNDVRLEAKIAERVLSSVEDQQKLGDQVP
jgi:two-component system, chemotaxis family, protein-glutamate methylesterase/glutaminase